MKPSNGIIIVEPSNNGTLAIIRSTPAWHSSAFVGPLSLHTPVFRGLVRVFASSLFDRVSGTAAPPPIYRIIRVLVARRKNKCLKTYFFYY